PQSRPCVLSGTNLFLATAFSATQDFADPIPVPLDFTGTQLEVPHPANGAPLYVKLRDDPATIQTMNMPVTLVPLRSLASESRREPPATEAAPQSATPAAGSPADPPIQPADQPRTAPPTGTPTAPAKEPPPVAPASSPSLAPGKTAPSAVPATSGAASTATVKPTAAPARDASAAVRP
ncbi:MAG: hypothetical protein ACRD25_11260, partial [Terracidiphilus sp.]